MLIIFPRTSEGGNQNSYYLTTFYDLTINLRALSVRAIFCTDILKESVSLSERILNFTFIILNCLQT